MPIQINIERYRCEHCDREYDTVAGATDCEVSHEIIHIAIARSDLKALWSFLVTGNPGYVTRSLEQTLRKYNTIVGRM